ncbi:NAD(P)H-dependent oxidoreductase [Patescibacteria group bacterium]|nr:NAD(P)H-dependent oxidoreductase [Patescibacteria group bacterium]
MKILVIYYSLDGNTKFISEKIAESIGADILELKPKKELVPASGFLRYFWGGRQAIMGGKPELESLEKNCADYDLVFLGTPVWALKYAPPVNTFFSNVKLENKKIALFCCHGGAPGGTLNKMKKRLAGNEFVGAIDFREPLKHDKEAEAKRAAEWARGIAMN